MNRLEARIRQVLRGKIGGKTIVFFGVIPGVISTINNLDRDGARVCAYDPRLRAYGFCDFSKFNKIDLAVFTCHRKAFDALTLKNMQDWFITEALEFCEERILCQEIRDKIIIHGVE
jgi:hypothetical protein